MKFKSALLIPTVISTLMLSACQKNDSGESAVGLPAPVIAPSSPVTELPSIVPPILESAPVVSAPLINPGSESTSAEIVAVLLPVPSKPQIETLPKPNSEIESLPVTVEETQPVASVPFEEILVELPVDPTVETIASETVEDSPVTETSPVTEVGPIAEAPAVEPTVPASPIQNIQVEGQCANGRNKVLSFSDQRNPGHSEKIKIKCLKNRYSVRLTVLKERLPFLQISIQDE